VSVIITSILIGIPLLSIVWFVWADRRLKSLKAPNLLRGISFATLLLILGAFAWMILARQNVISAKVPSLLYSLLLIWGMLALPFLALPMMTGWSITRIIQQLFFRKKPTPPASAESAPEVSRRQFLGTTAVAVPLLATFGATAISVTQRNHFRIREITVPIRGLPRDLDGLRIAHLSDTHVGKFTHGKLLIDLAEATNRLKADLVLLTGDLIDQSLDDLPEALDMVRRIDPRSGLYLIEGNHDLFEGPEKFASGVKSAGFNLLRDENAVLDVKGHPLELLGIRWSNHGVPFDPLVDHVFNQRHNPEALPILLAHHPHAFDRAAELGIPLTLAGHTHGGQIMLTPEIGAGPMMFKYWSGLYQKKNTNLVVSNGAGNWFPLRTAAPAEIVHITVKRV
jgi:predicted MPP superfamily phosphohydrolase